MIYTLFKLLCSSVCTRRVLRTELGLEILPLSLLYTKKYLETWHKYSIHYFSGNILLKLIKICGDATDFLLTGLLLCSPDSEYSRVEGPAGGGSRGDVDQ